MCAGIALSPAMAWWHTAAPEMQELRRDAQPQPCRGCPETP